MDTSKICTEHAHRVGEKKRGEERQIVARFNSYKSKLDILRNCKKLEVRTKNLEQETFQFLRTLAKKPLLSERKNEKKY